MTEEQPKGRARGRARGRPRTAEELAAMQRPGEATSASSKPAGRGRGDSYEREARKVLRGRGISQERSAFATGPPAGLLELFFFVLSPGEHVGFSHESPSYALHRFSCKIYIPRMPPPPRARPPLRRRH